MDAKSEQTVEKHNCQRKQLKSLPEKVSSLELGLGFRKRLSSHLSVYNVLTNPDLDQSVSIAPVPLRNDNFISLSLTPLVPSYEFPVIDRYSPTPAWQAFNLPTDSFQDSARLFRLNSSFTCASPRPSSASILSNSTDEDFPSDSLVMVPSASKLKVLVFETDEEDNDVADEIQDAHLRLNSSPKIGLTDCFDDDAETLTSNTQAHSLPVYLSEQNMHRSFIMPKMSLSQDSFKFQLTILSSNTELAKSESRDFVAMIENFNNSRSCDIRLHVSHLALSKPPLRLDLSLVYDSDCLFLLNDGLLVLGETMTAVAKELPQGKELAKVTVINILTSNYFCNLFHIINGVLPFQIWRTSTLKSNELSAKVKAFVEAEMAVPKKSIQQKTCNKTTKKRQSLPHKEIPHNMCLYNTDKGKDSSEAESDYKSLEVRFQNELAASSALIHTDPLNISSSLSHLRVFLGRIPKSRPFGGDDPRSIRRFIVLCGFSVGIGVGVLLGTSYLFRLVFQKCDRLIGMSFKPVIEAEPLDAPIFLSSFASVLVTEKFKAAASYFVDGLDDIYTQYVCASPCNELLTSLGCFKDRFFEEVLGICTSVVRSAKGRNDEYSGMISSIFD